MNIGVIAPGSPVNQEKIDLAIKQIVSLDMTPFLGKHLSDQDGFVAGRDEDRLADIHAMYTDSDIDAIWCIRGGYGCARLLPLLDYKIIRKHPKPLIGYSDITALHCAIYKKTNRVGWHAAMPATQWNEYTTHAIQALFGQVAYNHSARSYKDTLPYTVHPGNAEGRLIGGNLSILASLCGTKYLPRFKNNLVFIEDVGEKPYRIDRMLHQLAQASDFDKAAGYILGHFAGCEAVEGDYSLSLKETLTRFFLKLGKPCYVGAPFGHIHDVCAIPFGAKASMNAELQIFSIEENVSILKNK